MANANVSVTLTSNKNEVLKALDEAIERALNEIGLTAEGYAKRLVPTDTSRLKNSITYATSTKHGSGEGPAKEEDYEPHGEAEKGTVYIGTNVEYAGYVELGTSKMKAQPYLRPAVENHKSKYRKIMEDELKNA